MAVVPSKSSFVRFRPQFLIKLLRHFIGGASKSVGRNIHTGSVVKKSSDKSYNVEIESEDIVEDDKSEKPTNIYTLTGGSLKTNCVKGKIARIITEEKVRGSRVFPDLQPRNVGHFGKTCNYQSTQRERVLIHPNDSDQGITLKYTEHSPNIIKIDKKYYSTHFLFTRTEKPLLDRPFISMCVQNYCDKGMECKLIKVKLCNIEKPKKLPPIEACDCPCVEPPPIKDVPPLRRLKKVTIPEPPRVCPKVTCPPRADDGLKVQPKILPKIEPSLCPCIEPPPLAPAPPLKRLPKKVILEPPKICPCGDACCPPRADANLKIEPKKLPPIESCDCPCVEPPPLKDVPPLKRLKKVNIPQPPRICPPVICPPRADDGLKVQPKNLPKLVPIPCPCVEPPPIAPAPPLKRLPKKIIPEPPRICPCGDACCPPRADANLKIEPKKLPPIESCDCPCVEPPPLVDVPPLKRLKKIEIKEPPRVCPLSVCPPRADDGLKIQPKVLPKIEPSLCPCIEPPPLLPAPPLKRLPKKVIPEPPKICPCGDACCPPRADANLKIEPKKLPPIESCDCPCVEPPPLKDVPPLKRLKKVNIPQPPRICPPVICPPRADDGLKVQPKNLPKLVPIPCPCVEPPPIAPAPPLKRLPKKIIPEPPRICPCGDACCPPRADANLKIEPKKLPPIESCDCPCVEPPPLVDVPPLKRLKKVEIKEPPRVCPLSVCPPRADDGLKIQPKILPKIEPSLCPCIEPPPLAPAPPLKRLPKKVIPEPPKICPCGDACCPPRADANLKIEPKKLPPIESCDCPCVEPPPLKDVPPLKRLKKVNIPQPPRICPPVICPPRADDGLKVQPKNLPKIVPSPCPCVEPPPIAPAPPLKRLPKRIVPEPPRICPCGDACCPPRADKDCWTFVFCEPKTEDKKCFHTCSIDRLDQFDRAHTELKINSEHKQQFVIPISREAYFNHPCHTSTKRRHVPGYILLIGKKYYSTENLFYRCDQESFDQSKECPLNKSYSRGVFMRHYSDKCDSGKHGECKLIKVKLCNVDKPRKLPPIEACDCPCVEPLPLKDVPPLRRLKKVTIPEPPRVCPKVTCPPRADDGLKVQPKVLPKIEPSLCPCIEPPPLAPAPPLKRLPKKVIPEPPKICPCGDACCPPRADANLKIKPKKLPPIESCDCPCVEPPPLKDMPPLKRLRKVNIPQPQRICPPVICPPRADDGLKVQPKNLPKIVPSPCPCVEPPPKAPAPPLKRLPKKIVPEPPRICPCGDACCPPRADKDCWTFVFCKTSKDDKKCYSTWSISRLDRLRMTPFIVSSNYDSIKCKNGIFCRNLHFCSKVEENRKRGAITHEKLNFNGIVICSSRNLSRGCKKKNNLSERQNKNGNSNNSFESFVPKKNDGGSKNKSDEKCKNENIQNSEISSNSHRLSPSFLNKLSKRYAKSSSDSASNMNAIAKFLSKTAYQQQLPDKQSPSNNTLKTLKKDQDLVAAPDSLQDAPSQQNESVENVNCSSESNAEIIKPTEGIQEISLSEKEFYEKTIVNNPMEQSTINNALLDNKNEKENININSPISKENENDMSTSLEANQKNTSLIPPIYIFSRNLFNYGKKKLSEGKKDDDTLKPSSGDSSNPTDKLIVQKNLKLIPIDMSNTLPEMEMAENCSFPGKKIMRCEILLHSKTNILPNSEKFKNIEYTKQIFTNEKNEIETKEKISAQVQSVLIDTYPRLVESRQLSSFRGDDCSLMDCPPRPNCCPGPCSPPPKKQCPKIKCPLRKPTLFEKIINYFKARPGCPTPEELEYRRLVEEAQFAAKKVGLCLYDPKKNCVKLPKVITTQCREPEKKSC